MRRLVWARGAAIAVVASALVLGLLLQRLLRLEDRLQNVYSSASGGGGEANTDRDIRVPYLGGRLLCTRAARDAEFGALASSFSKGCCCGGAGKPSRKQVDQLEALWTVEEWPFTGVSRKQEILDESRKHPLLPLLAKGAIRRYLFFDLGARTFESSTGDFLTSYPRAERFEVFAFELNKTYVEGWRRTAMSSVWRKRARSLEIVHGGVTDHSGFAAVAPGNMMHIGSAENSGGAAGAVPLIDFAGFLAERAVPEDFVVVKMDVEGAEFNILPALARTGALRLIDELMLETHYTRRSSRDKVRTTLCNASRQAAERRACERHAAGGGAGTAEEAARQVCVHRNEVMRWFEMLREACIWAHEWP